MGRRYQAHFPKFFRRPVICMKTLVSAYIQITGTTILPEYDSDLWTEHYGLLGRERIHTLMVRDADKRNILC